jgi:hypothetical protein
LRAAKSLKKNSSSSLAYLAKALYAKLNEFSFDITQFGLSVNRVRGLLNASVYALLSVLCCVLNREAAENMGRPEKAISPTFFNV